MYQNSTVSATGGNHRFWRMGYGGGGWQAQTRVPMRYGAADRQMIPAGT